MTRLPRLALCLGLGVAPSALAQDGPALAARRADDALNLAHSVCTGCALAHAGRRAAVRAPALSPDGVPIAEPEMPDEEPTFRIPSPSLSHSENARD